MGFESLIINPINPAVYIDVGNVDPTLHANINSCKLVVHYF